jgi:hypothetical protein
MVMMMVINCPSRHKRRHRLLVASRMPFQFAASAHALVRLDMRTGRNLLQKNLNRLRAFGAFETQEAGGFTHVNSSIGVLEGADYKCVSRHSDVTSAVRA